MTTVVQLDHIQHRATNGTHNKIHYLTIKSIPLPSRTTRHVHKCAHRDLRVNLNPNR